MSKCAALHSALASRISVDVNPIPQVGGDMGGQKPQQEAFLNEIESLSIWNFLGFMEGWKPQHEAFLEKYKV